MKTRLDRLLVQRGFAPSRERAQALILAGRVLVNEQKAEKAGANVDEGAPIRILGDDQPFVSRGGLKLARALEHWHIDVNSKTCLDIGASTGGFSDCLLQNGAAQVIAVDTGYGQIDARLRSDARVRLLEKTNARYLTPQQLWPDPANMAPVSLVVMDVSFISAALVLPAVASCARASQPSGGFELVVLVKPQFEVGHQQVGKGGIVRDPKAQREAVEKIIAAVENLGGKETDVIESPILGTEGNREFLLHAHFPKAQRLRDALH
ncbi:MAG: TlyA family RNA methyltransferase [Acidobacteriota bacterium]|nr:TlyA family RNA methyltransferase [Acidobacteriota bacterium]